MTIRELNEVTDRLYDAMERDDIEALRGEASEHPGLARSILHEAVRHGSPGFVAVLVELGAAVNVPDECDATPLIHAAQVGLEMVRVLVEAGADPNALPEESNPEIDADRHGEPALFWALVAGRQDVIDFLAPLTRPDLRTAAYGALYRWCKDEEL